MAFWFVPKILFSQNFPDLKFRHLNISNGLPNDKVFFTFKDSKNLLWIATGNGLIRYDGHHYKIYSEGKANKTGFYGKSAGKIIEDSSGNLYIGTERGLNYYERKSEKFLTLHYKKAPDGKEFILPQYIDNKNRLWVFSAVADKLVAYNLNTKTFKESNIDFVERLSIFPSVFYKPLQLVISPYHSVGIRIAVCENGEPNRFKDYFTGTDKKYPATFISHKFFTENENNLWLPSGLGLIWLNPTTGKHFTYNSFNNSEIGKVTCVVPLGKNYLLAGTGGNGIYVFDKFSKKFIKNIRHTDTDLASPVSNKIDDIFCDKENNIFLSSYDKGIDIASWPATSLTQSISRQTVQQFNTTNHFTFIRRITDSLFWCVNEENKILQWNVFNNVVAEPAVLKRFNSQNNITRISQIYIDGEKRVWVVTDKVLFYKNESDNILHSIPVAPGTKRIAMLQKGKYLFTSVNALFLLTLNLSAWYITEINIPPAQKLSNYSTIHTDNTDGTVYILGDWGQVVSKFKQLNGSLQFVKRSEWSNAACTESYSFSNSSFLLMPGHNGLLQFNKNDFSFKKLCEGQVADNALSSLIQYNDTTFFVLAGNTLVKISPDSWISSTEIILLPDAVKQRIHYNSLYNGGDGFTYIATDDGIVKYNPVLKNTDNFMPEIYFSSLLISDKPDSLYKAPEYIQRIVLSPGVSGLDIFISNLNFTNDNSLENIQYRLLNYHTAPQQADVNGRIHINKLPPGTYQLNFIQKTDGRLLRKVTIVSTPYWYQSAWFKTLLGLLIAGLLIMAYRFRVKQIRKQEQLKLEYENKMLHLEMQNLRSQMNPHFIFNSLNSINSFIVENKTHLASDYLTKFSRLIRLILDNSKTESISLEKELETLKLYLLMESIRFENKFDYTIHTEPGMDEQSIKVPPMIIQPYVENAIWHGLLHKNEKGKVEVSIKKIDNALQIIIEDDGIGKSKAAEMRSKNIAGTKSYGMQITEQRIKQLDDRNSVETTDLRDKQGNAAGTKVEVLVYINV